MISLRSKCFRLVSETAERDSRSLAAREMKQEPKLTLVPRSLLLNRTEPLATQATND